MTVPEHRTIPGDFGDVNRRWAAMAAELAEDTRNREKRTRKLAEHVRRTLPAGTPMPPEFDDLVAKIRTDRKRAELIQQLAAAQAIAHDEMIAAGGHDNPEAYEQYCRTTQRHLALIPRFES